MDARTQAAIEGAMVSANGGISISDSSGRAGFPGDRRPTDASTDPASPAFWTVEASGYSPRIVAWSEVDASDESMHRVELQPSATLEVCVTDGSGRPAEGVVVSITLPRVQLAGRHLQRTDGASSNPGIGTSTDSLGEPNFAGLAGNQEWSAQIDSKGCVLMPGLPADVRLTVRLGRQGIVLERPSTSLVLAASTTTRVEYTLPVEGDFYGTLLGPNAVPIPRQTVWVARAVKSPTSATPAASKSLFSVAVAAYRETRTDDSGRFTITKLPAGDWYVGPAPFPPDVAVGKQADSVVAPVGIRFSWDGKGKENHVIECEAPAWIQGYVVDPKGLVAGARIHVEPVAFPGVHIATSSSGGEVRIGPLAVGDYNLLPLGPNMASCGVRTRARAPSHDVLLELGGSGTIRLVAGSDASETAWVVERVLATRTVPSNEMDWITLPGGSLPRVFGPLPEGRWSLAIATTDGRLATAKDIEILADGQAEAHVHPAPSCVLRVSLSKAASVSRTVFARWAGIGVDSQRLEAATTHFELRLPRSSEVILEFREGTTVLRQESVRVEDAAEQHVQLDG